MIDFASAKEKARSLRKAADGFISKIIDDPVEINNNLGIIRHWEQGSYKRNEDVRMYENVPYKCIQTHDSTLDPSQNPSVASLWMEYHGTTPETARPFKHPTMAEDIYKTGEYMIWTNGAVMKAIMDTSYSPDEYLQAWETYNGGD